MVGVGKGVKAAVVVLAPATGHAIDVYLDGRVDGPLFATSTGRRLDRPAVWRKVRQLARHAGLPQTRLSPRSTRATAITLLLDASHTPPETRSYQRKQMTVIPSGKVPEWWYPVGPQNGLLGGWPPTPSWPPRARRAQQMRVQAPRHRCRRATRPLRRDRDVDSLAEQDRRRPVPKVAQLLARTAAGLRLSGA